MVGLKIWPKKLLKYRSKYKILTLDSLVEKLTHKENALKVNQIDNTVARNDIENINNKDQQDKLIN